MSYDKFFLRYLEEAPQQLDGLDSYDAISNTIGELLTSGATPEELNTHTFKISSGDSAYYWIGTKDGSNIQVCSNVVSDGKFAKVNSTSKNPKYANKSPYAIDLYLEIANTVPQGVRFSSDKIISSDGIKVWQRIFNAGKEIAVYDNKSDSYVVDRITSMAELKQYVNKNSDFQKYQYVLAEAVIIIDIKGSFAIMECKRLANYPLQQLFKGNK